MAMKTKWKGDPVRKPVKFIEVCDSRTGKVYSVALLECGHGAEVAPTRFRQRVTKRGAKVQQQGTSCCLCGRIEKAKALEEQAVTLDKHAKKASKENRPELAQFTATLADISRLMTKLDERLTTIEDVTTRPGGVHQAPNSEPPENGGE